MTMTSTGKSVGEVLREGRLHQRLSIAECAKRTHISPRYLEALEAERWTDLPSESHRTGFLRLYARFLGVYTEELMQVYNQSQLPPLSEQPVEVPKRARPQVAPRTLAWPQLVLVSVVLLASFWAVYHSIKRSFPDQHMDLSWLRLRPSRANRLVAPPKREIPVQRIRAKADSDTWLRIMDRSQLVFEGILPGGAVKEWSGPGPFQLKLGNSRAVAIFWNDQPVNVQATARSGVAELQLPPATEPAAAAIAPTASSAASVPAAPANPQ